MTNSEKITNAAKKLKKIKSNVVGSSDRPTKATSSTNSEKIANAAKKLKNNSNVSQNASKVSNVSKIESAAEKLNGAKTYNVEAETVKLEKMQKNKQAAYDVSKQRLDLQNKIYMQAISNGDDDVTAKQKALSSPELAAFDAKLSELGYEYKANADGTPYSVFSQLEQKEKKHEIKSIEANVLQAGDYKEKSVYIPQTKKDKNVVDHVKTVLGNIDSELYSYINDPALREDIDIKYQEGNSGNYYSNNGYHLLTDDEKGVYNYLYSQDKNKARKYLDAILPDLRKRATVQIEEKAVAIAQEHPRVATALSFGTNLADTYMAPIKAGALVLGKYDDAQGVLDRGNAVTTAIRQEGAKDAAEKIPVNVPLIDKNLGELLYGAGTSIGDMAVAMAAGGKNSKAVAAIMSSSAGSSAVTSAKKNGASDIEALARGVGAAAIEYATEKWSVEKLFAEPETALSYFTQNVVAEGTEEGVSNVSNIALDVVVSDITNNENEIRKDIVSLVETEGISEKEAAKKVLISRLQDVGSDVLVGSFTGAVMSAPTTVKTSVSQKQFDKKFIDKDALSEFSNKTEVKTASRNIAGAVLKGAVLGSSSKSDILNNMYERGYSPSAVIKSSMSDNSSLSDELIGNLNRIIDSLDVEFASAMYADNPTASARAAVDTYMKALSISNAINAIKGASAVSDSFSSNGINEKTAKKSLKKASTQLPNHLSVNVEVGDVYENISKIIENANNYILSESENVYETASDFSSQMIDVLNEASNTVGNVKNKSAVADMLMNGNIESNINTVLSDKGATRLLENVLGMYITSGTKRSEVVSRIYEMRAAYRTGKGTEYSQRVSIKLNKLQMYSRQLNRLGIKGDVFSFVIDGFRNTILNGKLTQSQAEAIAENKSAYDLFVKVTAGVLTDNSTIDDMITAAGYVSGFDISSDIASYSENSASYSGNGTFEVVESDSLVPGEEIGIYDSDGGRIVLNKKAPLNKKLGYRLAREVVGKSNQREIKIQNDITGDSYDDFSIKDQIKSNLYLLSSMDVVASIEDDLDFEYNEELVDWVLKQYELIDFKVNRKNFGEIIIDKKRIKKGLSYFSKPQYKAEKLAFKALPYVLQNGVKIGEHIKHKGRDYDTVTFAAPILLHGRRINMAAVVRQEGKNYYKVHRLLSSEETDITLNKKDISETAGGVNFNSSLSPTDDVFSNIIYENNKNVNSLTNDILKYMRSSGYDVDAEYTRVIRKLNPYVLEHRSRINGSFLTDENFSNEITADFLTKVFTESSVMEKLADNNLDLAVDLAERVQAFSKTTPDNQLREFANDVASDLISVIRSDGRADELHAVLHNRTQNGIDSPALFENMDNGRINFSEDDAESPVTKIKNWYNSLKRGFVDSGEAIARLGKLLDNETIYHRYNNTKQSQDAIAYMLEKMQTDIEGNKIGKSLKSIFKPIIADKAKYEKFCLYMQYINNAERAVNDKAIFTDMTREESLDSAERLLRENPVFKKWANDVYKYNDGLMRWLIDSGLLSSEQYKKMKEQNPHYVPAFVIDTTKHDKPSFVENIVVKKTVKRAKGGAEVVMPLLDALEMKTSQVIKEARMNMLALEIVDTMKRKDLLEEGPKGLEVKDPALEEFVYQITAVRNSKYYEPMMVNGKYVTTNTNRKFKDNIKELFSFATGKKNEANSIVDEYVKKITLSESFFASDAATLVNDLVKLSIVPDANTDTPYYQYPELRRELASSKIYVPPEVVNEIPDFTDFRRRLMGGVILTTKQGGGTHVDNAYNTLSERYPELFDKGIINSTDQLERIREVVELLKKPAEVSFEKYHGQNSNDMTADLIDEIKLLSIQALKDAKTEREDIKADAEAHAYATYDVASTNNFAFSKDEQDGNRMVFYADGVRHTMDIGRGMFEGLKNISFDPDAKSALVPAQRVNDLFKKLVTSYNPFFSVRNFIRDLQDAVMYSSDAKRMLRNLPRAYKEISSGGEMWQLYQSLGGVGSSYFDFKEQIDLETDLSTKSKINKTYKNVSAIVENINKAVEQAPRLAEFITVLEKSDGSYASKLKALYAAADVTVNFGRSGIYSRFLNSTVVPFYNPGVQGLSRFIRMFTEVKSTRQLIMLSAKLLALGFAAGGINELINAIWKAANDDEEDTYEQLTDYQKQNNILIPIGDGRYIKIPKGRSVNVFGIQAQNLINATQGEDVDWFGGIKTAVEQISPNNPFTDNLVAPLIAAASNRTWYGSSIESTADEQVKPSQRYDETTDYLSRWLGNVLNYSPKKIHYVLDSYSGVVGDYVLPILTPKGGGNVFENVAMTAGSNFIVDGTTSNRISSDYYSLIDELTYEKNNTSEDDPTAASISLRFMNVQTKAIREFYSEIQKVNSGDLSPNEKAEKSRELKSSLNGIMLNAIAAEQEVYAAAESIKSKYAYKRGDSYYDNEGYELSEDKYHDIIYREVNREVFGAEYALQTYDAKVYAKAVDAVKNGADFDLYYDAYFDTKSIEGDIDFTKGTIVSGSTRKNKWICIKDMDASRKEKSALASSILDIDDKKLREASSYGVDRFDYIDFLCSTSSFSSDKEGSKKEKVLRYINSMSVSRKEKDSLYILAGYSKKTISDAPWR